MSIIKGWNTILFNLLVAIFGVLEATDWTDILPAEYQGYFLLAVGAVNMFLRARTNTPIGSKE